MENLWKVKHLFILMSVFLISIGMFWVVNLVLEVFLNVRPPLDWHHDFLAFYSAGYLVLHGQAGEIFNSNTVANFQFNLIHEKVGAAGYMAYINPPFVAVLLTPLGFFNFDAARMVWLLINASLALLIVGTIVKEIDGWKKYLCWALLVGIFPIYQALIEGQQSIVILGASLMGLILIEKGKYWTGGFFLSALVIKPQLAAPLLVGLLIFRRWKIALGMAIGSMALILLTLPFVGIQSYVIYVQYLFGVTIAHFNGAGLVVPAAWHGDIRDMSGINSFWVGIFGQVNTNVVNLLTVVSILVLLGFYIFAARKVKPGLGKLEKEVMLSASVGLILLTDLHLYAQDLVLALIIVPIVLQRFMEPLFLIVPLVLLLDVVAVDPKLPLHIFPVIVAIATIYIFTRGGDFKRIQEVVGGSFR